MSRKPSDVAKYLEKDQARLYELIWKRAVASQMASAEVEQTTADIEVKGRDGKTYTLRATGSVIQFEGFLKVYEEGRDERLHAAKGKDDVTPDEDDASRRLPVLSQGDKVTDRSIEAEQHFTQPPPRFSEATLVKKMEELGIGRPSTYASTLAVLQERQYVRIDKKRLIPEDKGRLVIAFLEGFFKRYVEYDFTADLEEKLDLISDGKLAWKDVLRDFWREFTGSVDDIKDLRVGEVLEALNEILGPHIFPPREDGSDPRSCPSCKAGRLSLKISGKYGAFIGCGNYPECRYTRQLSDVGNGDGEAVGPDGKQLGFDPDSGLAVTLRTGRFGPYLQLGEGSEDEKPKRSSLPKGVDAGSVDLEYALKLLSLPREVGLHPETGKPITAGLGRYGPFVLHDGMYANVEGIEEVFSVGLNRAVALLAEKAAGNKSRFQRAKPTVLKDLGEHPDGGGKIEVLSGRYGPYVKHGAVNATIPNGKDPAAISVAEAVELIAARAAKGPSKKKKPVRKAAGEAKPAAKGAKSGKAAAGKPPRVAQPRSRRRPTPRPERSHDPPPGTADMPRRPKGNQKGGPPKRDGLPGRDEIIEFIKTSPTKVGKREIARAFGVRGPQRVDFNRLLASMTEDGMLSGDRKSLRKKGGLPPVTILEVTGRDDDGDLIAKPAVWEEEGERPEVLIAPRKARGPEVDIEASIGVGDRVLARISEIDDPSAGYRFEAFPIKRLPREKRRLIGIFRAHRNGGGSIEPVDRKQLRSWSIAKGDEGPAKDGDLVRFDLAKKGRFNVPQARVLESIGNPDDQRQISLIAVHATASPTTSPRASSPRARR